MLAVDGWVGDRMILAIWVVHVWVVRSFENRPYQVTGDKEEVEM
jgi:hypothetical protein